jgi:glucose/arabinose dehydrogenase
VDQRVSAPLCPRDGDRAEGTMTHLARLMGLLSTAVITLPACTQAGPHDTATSTQRQALGPAVGLQFFADGCSAPVALVEPDDGSGRRFVVDQVGLIRIVTPAGELLEEPFLDLRPRMVSLNPAFDERGLLGLAFHPGFASNGRFFASYSAPLRPGGPEGWHHTSHVSEFSISAIDPDRADHDSERLLVQVDQPQFNHNAGDIAFGPDGMLYIALGDGGGANDVGLGHTPDLGNGQDATNLLGSILRIAVAAAEPYEIPADNPFVGTIGRDEMFAYGFRNPWRIAFDPEHGLLAADVGQDLWEQVNVVVRGGNYGWNIREGSHCFDPDEPTVPPDDCPDTRPLFGDPLIDPVIEYGNVRTQPETGIGIAVIGGRVYRGSSVPQLHGRYVFGDWSTDFAEPAGTLLLAAPRTDGPWRLQELRVFGHAGDRLGQFVRGFGHDTQGEVYGLTSDAAGPTGDSGRVYRIVQPGHQQTAL